MAPPDHHPLLPGLQVAVVPASVGDHAAQQEERHAGRVGVPRARVVLARAVTDSVPMPAVEDLPAHVAELAPEGHVDDGVVGPRHPEDGHARELGVEGPGKGGVAQARASERVGCGQGVPRGAKVEDGQCGHHRAEAVPGHRQGLRLPAADLAELLTDASRHLLVAAVEARAHHAAAAPRILHHRDAHEVPPPPRGAVRAPECEHALAPQPPHVGAAHAPHVLHALHVRACRAALPTLQPLAAVRGRGQIRELHRRPFRVPRGRAGRR
mmetsp:Transcript_88591/g.247810  ORF Transcript_88591/g.247810 Transcript_88591/m.247810 type:complete len:268 (+) Transcript_88591:173-976(+)